MRILLVNDNPLGVPSGAEIHLARLAAGLEAAGDTIDLFAGEVSHRGVRKVLDLWDPMARRAVRGRARRFRADVVHYHNVLRELSVSVLAADAEAATVMTVHDPQIVGILDALGRGRNRRHDRLRGLKLMKARLDRAVASRQIDAFIAVSAHLADLLRAAGLRNVVWVPAFAPAAAAPTRAPSDSKDLLFAGRLLPEKGIYVLLDAFARVAAERPDARLMIAGSGVEERRVRESASRLGDRVVLLGPLDEDQLHQRMTQVRAVVVPSVWLEAAGLVVVEAAIAGRPVVVTDDPGLRELVDAAGCGLVVPKEDAPALAEAIRRLLDDPALADAMGAAGRTRAMAERTTDAAVAATRRVYLDARAARRRVSAGER